MQVLLDTHIIIWLLSEPDRIPQALGNVPLLHNGPFDHQLMAQAISKRIALATMDKSILDYKLKNLQFL